MNNHGSWYPFWRQTQFAYGLIMSYNVILRYFVCLRLDRILMTMCGYMLLSLCHVSFLCSHVFSIWEVCSLCNFVKHPADDWGSGLLPHVPGRC
jgi:hypothetical protein